jgi:hypothetical protein
MSVKLRKNKRFFHFSIATTEPLCHGRLRLGGEAPKKTSSKVPTIALNPTARFNSQQKDGYHGCEEEEEGQEGCEEVSSFSREQSRPT